MASRIINSAQLLGLLEVVSMHLSINFTYNSIQSVYESVDVYM